MNIIQQNWENYKQMVLPSDASDIQIVETQKSFYAGAWSVLNILTKIADRNMSEDAMIEIFQGLIDECQMFKDNLLKSFKENILKLFIEKRLNS